MSRLLASLILGAALLSAQSPQRTESMLRLRAVNVFGRPLDSYHVHQFIDESGNDLVGRFRFGQSSIDGIPYGTYRIAANKTGYRDFEATVEVYGPEIMVTICFEAEAMESTARLTTGFSGQLVGAIMSDAWCNATGVYLRLQYESRLGSDGRFDFGQVAPGTYTLACHAGTRPILSQELVVDGGAPPFRLTMSPERR